MFTQGIVNSRIVLFVISAHSSFENGDVLFAVNLRLKVIEVENIPEFKRLIRVRDSYIFPRRPLNRFVKILFRKTIEVENAPDLIKRAFFVSYGDSSLYEA